MSISQIPEDTKLKIFSYFTTKEISKLLAPVCTEWWILSKDLSLWKRLELNICHEKPAYVYRQVIARCETSLKSLTLQTANMRNELIAYLKNFKLKNLKELDLRGWRYIYNNEICSLVDNFPNLEILRLRVRLGTSGLGYISNLRKLKSLTISGHVLQKVRRPDLELITRVCTKLEALILEIQDGLDDQFLLQLAEFRKETLKHLVLPRDFLTPIGIRAVTTCQNLSTLCMKGRFCHYSNEILTVLSTVQKLEWLNLGGTVVTIPETWNNFFSNPNLSSLKILEISGTDINDSGLVSLALTCKHLVILDLSRNYFVHDGGVQAVIDNCSQLWFLDVSTTQVTRDLLLHIPRKLPRLRYLIVPVWCGIDERDLRTFTLTYPLVKVSNKYGGTHVDYTVDESLNLKWQS